MMISCKFTASRLYVVVLCLAGAYSNLLCGADNGLSATPALGWTSWSSLETRLDSLTIKSIADRQAALLKPAGYIYVNVDGGWYANPDTGVDFYGRWTPHPDRFPSGMRAIAQYVHSLGLKFGLYLTPGIPKLAVVLRTPVKGTSYTAADIVAVNRQEITYLGGTMYSIDYTRPGAQEFVNSWADLLAEWEVDYLKLDAVSDGNVADLAAWSKAIQRTGRPISLALANNLNPGLGTTWRSNANSWRISTDIESYDGKTLTNWANVALRFGLVPNWLNTAGKGGWNDLDSLLVGNDRTGLSRDERQSMMTFWALCSSPLLVGDDIREIDDFGVQLLTNPAVLAIDQNGVVAAPVSSGKAQQVWTALEPDGSYAVGLFNLGDDTAVAEVKWSDLGFKGAASVRDLWSGRDLGTLQQAFSTQLNRHASALIGVTPSSPVLQLLAGSAAVDGGAYLDASTVGPGGQRVRGLDTAAKVQFSNIKTPSSGNYNLTILYINGDAIDRRAVVAVNGTENRDVVFSGAGDWQGNMTVQSVTVRVLMSADINTVVLKNALGPAPDIIGITLQRAEDGAEITAFFPNAPEEENGAQK